MTLTLHLPDELEAELRQASRDSDVTMDQCAADMLYQTLSERRYGEDAKLENRPDWQQSLDRARTDREADRVISHEEVLEWQRSRAK